MLRFSFLVVFFALFCSSFGQFIDGRNFFTIGVSNTSIISRDFESRSRIGWNSSFGARINALDNLDVNIFVNVGTNGATLTCREFDGSVLKPEPVELKFYFNKVAMNFQASYSVIDPTFRLNGGFCYGSKLFTLRKIEEGKFYLSNSDNLDEAIDVGAMFKELEVDFGLMAGISAGTEDFEIELSYTRFFNNWCKPVDYNNIGYQARNSILELKFLYFIELLW